MTCKPTPADSDSVNLGSNPSPPASEKPAFSTGFYGWTDWPSETNRAQTDAQKPAQRTDVEPRPCPSDRCDTLLFALRTIMGSAEHGQGMSWTERCKIAHDAIDRALGRAPHV